MKRKWWIAIIIGLSLIPLSLLKLNAEEIIQLSMDTVNTANEHLDNAEVDIDLLDALAPSPATYSIDNGAAYRLRGKWNNLNYEALEDIALNKDTTYQIDAISGEVIAESTPGSNKVNLIFEPIQIEAAVTDQVGQHLEFGQVSLDASATWQDSPCVFTIANGGSSQVLGKWLATNSLEKSIAIFKDTTYWIDALSGEMRSRRTPDINKINFVYNMTPSEVMITTKDSLVNNQTVYFVQLFEQFDLAAAEVASALASHNENQPIAAVGYLKNAQVYLQGFINRIQAELDASLIDADLADKTIQQAKVLISYLEQLKSDYR